MFVVNCTTGIVMPKFPGSLKNAISCMERWWWIWGGGGVGRGRSGGGGGVGGEEYFNMQLTMQ